MSCRLIESYNIYMGRVIADLHSLMKENNRREKILVTSPGCAATPRVGSNNIEEAAEYPDVGWLSGETGVALGWLGPI